VRTLLDPYADDLSMVLQVRGGVFLLCGCCHAGLLNTIRHVERTWEQPLVGIAGGVHLNAATAETIARTVSAVAATESLRHVWLGHCSGGAFMERLAEAVPSGRYRPGLAGDRLRIT
jgi:7,8-dihydropterin-6-yl-methyl-4-(beta-D-ribofuranosyl)aminobenzene 5'-phosphate synthase